MTRRSPADFKSYSAIVTHPWPTLGGSYNDIIVLHAVTVLLERGFTVGTFNLRYVDMSVSRPSVMSTLGFVQLYLAKLL